MEAPIIDYDVGFFLCDIKQGHNITSDRFRMVTLLDRGRSIFDQFTKHIPTNIPELQQFLNKSKGKDIILATARLKSDKRSKAISIAWQWLSHVRDVLCIADRTIPNVLSIAMVRQNLAKDIQLCWFMPNATLEYGNPNDIDLNTYNSRYDKVLNKLIPILSNALDGNISSFSPLLRQLFYSCRMFRLGDSSDNYGIEFLCKYSALEGMVVGGLRKNKHQTVKDRLSQLFKTSIPNISKIIDDFYDIRNDIAHEGKADLFHWDQSYHAPEPLLDDLTVLALVVIVFGSDNIDHCSSIEELWSAADKYTVNQSLLVKKCPGKEKYYVRDCELNLTDKLWQGAGKIFDDIFAMKMTT